MARHQRPSGKEFILAVTKAWGENVSGPFQVFFTILATAVISAASAVAVLSTDTLTRIMAGLLGLLALFLAIYKVWAKERDALCDLEGEIDTSQPKFIGAIDQWAAGQVKGQAGTYCHLQVSVKNLGAPSIAEAWAVTYVAGSESIPGRLEFIQDGTQLEIALTGGTLHLGAADAIYDKAMTPIPTGGLVRGWLRVYLAVDRSEAIRAGNKWILTFTDVRGREYQATTTVKGQDKGFTYVPDGSGTRLRVDTRKK